MSSFEYNNLTKRNIALDIIKCFGVLLITNAHSWDLWEVIDRKLAVGGAQGVSLFFFVSGFAMMIGSTKSKSFSDFVRDKTKRLWPPIFLWTIICSAFWGESIDWTSFFALKFCYWFISCIFVYYIICFFLVNRSLKTKWLALWVGVLVTSLIIWVLPVTTHGIYTDYHYYMYLECMILGMIVGEYEKDDKNANNSKIMTRFFYFAGSCVFLLSYFAIIGLCSGENNPYYLIQLVAMIPLSLMALFMYFAFRGRKVTEYVAQKRWINIPVIIVSQLSLEIYIVQFAIVSSSFNSLFPFSFVINYTLVLIMAYILKVLSNLFISIFDGKYANIEKLFYL